MTGAQSREERNMEYRVLGRTGLKPSCVALSSLSTVELLPAESDFFIHDALARGVTYFDVAPSYADGEAERRLGRALDGRRHAVILAGKTAKRTGPEARQNLTTTLRRLRTDHLDVYQLHGVDTAEELAVALGPGGAVEVIQKAVETGDVRFIGLTSHHHRLVMDAVRQFPFDTVLTPVNYALRSSCLPMLALLTERQVGVIAIKSTAHRPWRADEPPGSPERRRFPYCWYRPLTHLDAVARAVGWTLSQAVATAVPAASSHVARLVLDAAERGFPTPDSRALDALGLESLFEKQVA
jgi:aryl-alcohol dehydrogenase-like predicted oxidoreductase